MEQVVAESDGLRAAVDFLERLRGEVAEGVLCIFVVAAWHDGSVNADDGTEEGASADASGCFALVKSV